MHGSQPFFSTSVVWHFSREGECDSSRRCKWGWGKKWGELTDFGFPKKNLEQLLAGGERFHDPWSAWSVILHSLFFQAYPLLPFLASLYPFSVLSFGWFVVLFLFKEALELSFVLCCVSCCIVFLKMHEWLNCIIVKCRKHFSCAYMFKWVWMCLPGREWLRMSYWEDKEKKQNPFCGYYNCHVYTHTHVQINAMC